ncbi:MAG: hypothetical protein P8M80_01110 [Pirellulaceae bacterium]|nr:hypothetical protein [Pirellulaceae bacterium]
MKGELSFLTHSQAIEQLMDPRQSVSKVGIFFSPAALVIARSMLVREIPVSGKCTQALLWTKHVVGPSIE